jgi:hypothetical protein
MTRKDLENLFDAIGRALGAPAQLVKEIAQQYVPQSSNDIFGGLADIATDSLWVAGLEKCRAALARETTVYSYQDCTRTRRKAMCTPSSPRSVPGTTQTCLSYGNGTTSPARPPA